MNQIHRNVVALFILICGLSCEESRYAPQSPQAPPETGSLPLIDLQLHLRAHPAFILSDTKVQISGVLDVSDVTVSITVEYGHIVYDQTTPSQVVHTTDFPNGVTPFELSIDGLGPGTTYHWRLRVTTSRWVAYSPDAMVTLPATVKSFDLPLHIGELWKYRYSDSVYHHHGLHTWRIVSTDGNGSWTFTQTRVDTAITSPISIDSTSFILRSFPDYFQIEFPEWQGGFEHTRRIPRLFDTARDSLSFFGDVFYGGIHGYEQATFVRGIGLVSYGARQPLMVGGTSAYLDLIEHTSR